MSEKKNIVICCDGTGNRIVRSSSTNVLLLFMAVDLSDPDKQVGCYIPGVGTQPDSPLKRGLGLTFGYGLRANILIAYRYLMAEYRPGDDIFLFGFSRGACTVLLLLFLLRTIGLFYRGNEHLLPFAVNAARLGPAGTIPNVSDSTRRLTDLRLVSRPCPVKFLGMWDAVYSAGRLGTPLSPEIATPNGAKVVRHALSIDEQRRSFRPAKPSPELAESGMDVKEVWFAGAHSDVGGGFSEDESGLSKIPLGWMIKEAEPFGLIVDKNTARFIMGE